MLRRAAAGLLASLCLAATQGLWEGMAAAQEGGDESLESQRRRFAEAVSLFDAERYEEALSLFRELQGARPHPVLRFNVAWCLSRLERHEEALAEFEAYLEGGDDSAERAERSRAEVARLRALVETSEADEAAETPVPRELEEDVARPPAEGSPSSARPGGLHPGWFWASFGLTVAAGAAMAVTGGVTLHLSERWLEEGDIEDRDQGRALRNATDGLLIAVVCGAIASLVVGLFTDFSAATQSGLAAPAEPR